MLWTFTLSEALDFSKIWADIADRMKSDESTLNNLTFEQSKELKLWMTAINNLRHIFFTFVLCSNIFIFISIAIFSVITALSCSHDFYNFAQYNEIINHSPVGALAGGVLFCTLIFVFTSIRAFIAASDKIHGLCINKYYALTGSNGEPPKGYEKDFTFVKVLSDMHTRYLVIYHDKNMVVIFGLFVIIMNIALLIASIGYAFFS